MVRRLATAVALVVVAGSAAGAQTVVNFDDLSGNAPMPALYGGINWGAGWMYYDAPQFPYTPSSGFTRAYNYDADPTFTFSAPVTFQGLWLSGYPSASVQLTLYLGGSLVGTSAVLNPTDVPAYLASGYAGLVDEVHITPYDEANGGYWTADDFTYNATATPEPASLALVGTGMIALGAVVRRRRRA